MATPNGVTSWKTTLAGIVGGVSLITGNWLQTGHFDWKSLIVGSTISVLGWFAKDNNVSGGNVLQ